MPDLPFESEKIRDCYSRSIESTLQIISSVDDSRWSSPTPCADWNVKDVVNHLVYENRWMVELFNGKTIEEVGNSFEGDLVGEDPRGAYLETSQEVRAILAENDAMGRTCQISSGPASGAEYASQLFLDTLVHGWDISVGAGSPARLDVELVEACTPIAEMAAKFAAGSGAFAQPVSIGADVSPQTRLLAVLGRAS